MSSKAVFAVALMGAFQVAASAHAAPSSVTPEACAAVRSAFQANQPAPQAEKSKGKKLLGFAGRIASAAAPQMVAMADTPLKAAAGQAAVSALSQAGGGGQSASPMAMMAMGGGSAAPNPEAQAMLSAIGGMMAGRGDADSMAAAQALQQAAGRPGATGADAMAAALSKLGC